VSEENNIVIIDVHHDVAHFFIIDTIKCID